MELNRFEKMVIAARYWLLGMAESNADYYKVINALELCLKHHDGLRNGGEPEAMHMLSIFHQIRTLHKHIKNPVTVYILVFLHDAIEDPNQKTNAFISPDEIRREYGEELCTKLLKMSKNILGQKNEKYSLDEIFLDEDCSIAKGGDRANNVSTMMGVFKPARRDRYIKETAEEFVPRFKIARRAFPHQEAVYENLKLDIINQLTLINHIVNGTGNVE